MPTIRTTVEGDGELRRVLNQLRGAPRRQAQRRGLRAGASVIEEWAKFYAPVDTGALMGSIEVDEVTDTVATIAPHVEYAEHQEFGTSRMAAHPYMRPAIDQHERDILTALQAEIVRFVEGLG